MEAEVIIFALVVALVIAIPVLAILLLRRPQSQPWRSVVHGTVSYVVMTSLTALVLFLFFGLAIILMPAAFLGWILLAVVIVEGWRKHRATRQYGLLWLLTVSAERSMPLVPAIEAFAAESGGIYGRRARWAADMLRSGVPLPDVLDRVPGLVPAFAVPMIRIGCETGTLGAALRQVATTHNVYEPIWMAFGGKVAYLLFFVPPFGFGLLVFIMLKIVPSFQKIFADFGTTLPAMTQALIAASNFAGQFWYLLLPVYLLILWLFAHVTLRYLGWIQWDPPGIAGFTRRLDSAQILDTLALVAGQQRPVLEGIAALARTYPKPGIRWRLRQAGLDIEAGRDWCESLLARDLIRQPEMAVLQAAQRVGNLPWALREMADSARRRLIYRVQVLAQVVFPPIVILIGLVVMFIVVALFLPLLTLIQSLA